VHCLFLLPHSTNLYLQWLTKHLAEDKCRRRCTSSATGCDREVNYFYHFFFAVAAVGVDSGAEVASGFETKEEDLPQFYDAFRQYVGCSSRLPVARTLRKSGTIPTIPYTMVSLFQPVRRFHEGTCFLDLSIQSFALTYSLLFNALLHSLFSNSIIM
jgi:hypothetical protein